MPATVTEILALFTGLYLLAAGIGLLVDPRGYARMIEEFRANGALAYLAAIAAFVLGAFIVAVHNVWTGPTAILVSLIGWGALAEGVLLLSMRRKFLDLFAPLAEHEKFMSVMGICAAVLGALLLFSALG
jgi:hypothetical protein